jgi:putative ABC transport system ATP-binding protein
MLLKAERVTKLYGTGDNIVPALREVSFTLRAGEFVAIMGPSGSGKSTLMNLIGLLDRPSSGKLFLADEDTTALSHDRLAQLRNSQIGFVFQAYNLLPTLNASENITLPLALGGKSPDASWYDQVISTVHLADRLHHRPSELSGGQQQRVAVARALVTRPKIIFADEPTGNLDSHSGSEILTFMRRAVDELGQTIVMVTHDPAAASVADRVVFLADGRISDTRERPTIDEILDHLRALAS